MIVKSGFRNLVQHNNFIDGSTIHSKIFQGEAFMVVNLTANNRE